jgi:glycosyltransferase involved in cell wall biosynthesis
VTFNSSDLHVLLIPSEEFIPAENHLAGIFPFHQAKALRHAGARVGSISVRLALSIPMIARAALLRALRRRPGNVLDHVGFAGLGRTLVTKLFQQEKSVQHEAIGGINVVRVEGFYYVPPSLSRDWFGWLRGGMVAYDAYCRRYGKPDVLHAHNLYPGGLLAHRLSRRLGIPFVVTEHSSWYGRGILPPRLMPRLREAALAANSMLVVSPALGEMLVEKLCIPSAKLDTVPNVLDDLMVVSASRRLARSNDDIVFLSIGDLSPVKNHAMLIHAFAAAFASNRRYRLRICGTGELSEELTALVAKLGLDAQVSLPGRLSRDEVLLELDNCDAFVLSSDVETFGVVLIEALSRGRPVVATKCGGPDSIVEREDGLLVPTNDAAAMAKALTEIADALPAYDAAVLRQRAIARFGGDAIARRLTRIYEKALHVVA